MATSSSVIRYHPSWWQSCYTFFFDLVLLHLSWRFCFAPPQISTTTTGTFSLPATPSIPCLSQAAVLLLLLAGAIPAAAGHQPPPPPTTPRRSFPAFLPYSPPTTGLTSRVSHFVSLCRSRRRQWRLPSRGRPPSARPATRRCTSSTSSPPTAASTTRPASAATTARAPSSLPTTTRSKECSTAGLTSTSCSRGLGAWTRASKELPRLLSQKEVLGMRMLLKSRAHLLAPERNVLDATRQSIQLRGLLSTTPCTTRAASSAAMEGAPSALRITLRTRGSSSASTIISS